MPSNNSPSNEKFYVRDNTTKQWVTDVTGHPIQFTSQRSAKRHADKHCRRFLIIPLDTETRTVKWRGGERAH